MQTGDLLCDFIEIFAFDLNENQYFDLLLQLAPVDNRPIAMNDPHLLELGDTLMNRRPGNMELLADLLM
ncbi:hypothetical protein D3C71_2045500 [compost metagenome]